MEDRLTALGDAIDAVAGHLSPAHAWTRQWLEERRGRLVHPAVVGDPATAVAELRDHLDAIAEELDIRGRWLVQLDDVLMWGNKRALIGPNPRDLTRDAELLERSVDRLAGRIEIHGARQAWQAYVAALQATLEGFGPPR